MYISDTNNVSNIHIQYVEAGIKRCSDLFKVIPVAESKRLSSDPHEYEPIRDFLHVQVKTNFFFVKHKAHASHVLTCAHNVV